MTKGFYCWRLGTPGAQCTTCSVGYQDWIGPIEVMQTGYGINWNAGGYKIWPADPTPNFKVKKWTNSPAEIGYIFETNFSRVRPDYFVWLFTPGPYPAQYPPPLRHAQNNSSNLIYADGHKDVLNRKVYVSAADFPCRWQ